MQLKIKNTLQKLTKGDLVKTAIFTSPLSIIRIICAFIRSKISSIILGTIGVGLLSQSNQLSIVGVTIGSLGLVNGLMQRISYKKSNNDFEGQRTVQGTVLVSQLIMLGILMLFMLPFLSNISEYLFNSDNYELKVGLFFIIISIPITVIASNYIEAFFTGYERFDLYIKASSWATIVSLFVFVFCVYKANIKGALLGFLLNSVILLLYYLYYIRKIEKYKNVFIFKFNSTDFKHIFKEGVINLFCSFLVALTSLFIRNLIVKEYGGSENGIYQFVVSITAYYTPFLTNMLWAKYFPQISAKGICKETSEIMYKTLRFILLANTSAILFLMIVPNLILKLIATSQFVKAAHYMPIQFMGDLWYFLFLSYSIFLLATRQIKKYLIIYIIYAVSQYLISRLLIQPVGVIGIAIGYLLSSSIVGMVSLVNFQSIFRKFLNHKNIIYIFTICFIFAIVQALLLYYKINFSTRILVFLMWILVCYKMFTQSNKLETQ